MSFASSGCYGPDVNLDKLKDFHRRRLQVLVEAGPDLLAFETIPNKIEAQVCSLINYYLIKTFCGTVRNSEVL
jgi:S-methylmethionine-dependent homocysteine/selenocysteine methylase